MRSRVWSLLSINAARFGWEISSTGSRFSDSLVIRLTRIEGIQEKEGY